MSGWSDPQVARTIREQQDTRVDLVVKASQLRYKWAVVSEVFDTLRCTVRMGSATGPVSRNVMWGGLRPIAGDVVLVELPPPGGTRRIVHIARDVLDVLLQTLYEGTVKIEGVYNLTPPTVADGEAVDLQMDAEGNVKATLATALDASLDSVTAVGDIAHDSADSGKPLKIGGYAVGSGGPTAVAAGDRANAWLTLKGQQVAAIVSTNAVTDAIAGTAPNTTNDLFNAVMGVAPTRFNGASWDRERGNVDATLLTSAVRAVSTNSTDQTNYNGRGVALSLNVTVEAAGETLSLKIQGKDPVSGAYYDLVNFGVVYTSATQAPGCIVAMMSPGLVAADGAAPVVYFKSGLLPRIWRAVVTHSAAGNWTYSLGASVGV